MLELAEGFPDCPIVKLGLAGELKAHIGVQGANKGRRKGSVPALHVAVVLGRRLEKGLNSPKDSRIEGQGSLSGLALRRGKTHG